MSAREVKHVEKACAYITRNDSELLVFEGPCHDGLQIPKGTVERGESPVEAVYRETAEESGLAAVTQFRHLVTDVWKRRESPPKRYVRNFYHAPVYESRDAWTHTVTGTGAECGMEYDFFWVDIHTDEAFALELNDYLYHLDTVASERAKVDIAGD
jgi:ADP-ribose pyrophosphatase YjhB (NUDIX family)